VSTDVPVSKNAGSFSGSGAIVRSLEGLCSMQIVRLLKMVSSENCDRKELCHYLKLLFSPLSGVAEKNQEACPPPGLHACPGRASSMFFSIRG
jgi:hypothetical protein